MKLFDKVSEDVENYSDMLAERAGGLGGTAHGTIQAAAARSFLTPYDLGIADETSHVFAVSAALAAFGQSGVTRSTSRQASAMSIPPTFSPISRAASTSNSGSSISLHPEIAKAQCRGIAPHRLGSRNSALARVTPKPSVKAAVPEFRRTIPT